MRQNASAGLQFRTSSVNKTKASLFLIALTKVELRWIKDLSTRIAAVGLGELPAAVTNGVGSVRHVPGEEQAQREG